MSITEEQLDEFAREVKEQLDALLDRKWLPPARKKRKSQRNEDDCANCGGPHHQNDCRGRGIIKCQRCGITIRDHEDLWSCASRP